MITEASPIIDRQDRQDELHIKEGAATTIENIRETVIPRALEGLLKRDILSSDKQENGLIIKGTSYNPQTGQALDFNTTIDLSELTEKQEGKLQRDLWVIRNFNKKQRNGNKLSQAQEERVEAASLRTGAYIGGNITVQTNTSEQPQTKPKPYLQKLNDNKDSQPTKKKGRKGLKTAITSLSSVALLAGSLFHPDTQAQAKFDENTLEQSRNKVVQQTQSSLLEKTHSEIELPGASGLFDNTHLELSVLEAEDIEIDGITFPTDFTGMYFPDFHKRTPF